VLERSQWLVRDWDAAPWAYDLGTFDLILANPPYVEDGADIEPTVHNHEPHGALFAGPEGLDAYRVLVPQLPGLLAPGGIAIVEIGSAQADAVTAIAAESQLRAGLHRDLAGRPRAVELSAGA
jgi:release factor glutamine methyltransferase